MVCSGAKTKLMVVGTRELRQTKLTNEIEINVDGCRVIETASEKLLGVMMNNTMTWAAHLYGNNESKGLIHKLSQRASLVTKLAKVMPRNKLKVMAEGIFFSVLNYGIEVYGNVWGNFTLDVHQRSSTALTKEDNAKLQILVNKVLRSITGSDFETSVLELHEKSQQLSVQQRCAYFSIISIHKVLNREQPSYHLSRFLSSQKEQYISTRSRETPRIDYKLSISRCSFFYRSSVLYSCLPTDLVKVETLEIFKRRLKEWVRRNISIAPI